MIELELDCFNKLHLSEKDKTIGKELHPPVDGSMPRKHISAKPAGNDSICSPFEKLGESSYRGQCVMTNAIVNAFGEKKDNKPVNNKPYSFEFYRDKAVTMSPLYDDPSTKMELIMDHMWQKYRSDVFHFSENVMADL